MNNSFEGAAVAAARLRKTTAKERFFIMINIVWLSEFFVCFVYLELWYRLENLWKENSSIAEMFDSADFSMTCGDQDDPLHLSCLKGLESEEKSKTKSVSVNKLVVVGS